MARRAMVQGAMRAVVAVLVLAACIGVPVTRVGAVSRPCTEAGLNTALSAGGTNTFNCVAATTITVSARKSITRN